MVPAMASDFHRVVDSPNRCVAATKKAAQPLLVVIERVLLPRWIAQSCRLCGARRQSEEVDVPAQF